LTLFPYTTLFRSPVPVVHAADLRRAYALAAARFHQRQPSLCVAITGTNGKTSIASFCRQIFAILGHRAASMGTLGVVISASGQADLAITPPGLTTPDASDVAALMARMVDEGVTHLALEASSHGIDQRRIDGVHLTAAGFTNFTQDHLDYHGSMEAYRAAKLRLFEVLLPSGSVAVLNADSDSFEAFARAAVARGHRIVSTGSGGDGLRLLRRDLTPAGQDLTLAHAGNLYRIKLPLAGGFQADNALVAAGLCLAAGEDPQAVFSALESLVGAPGRMQRVEAGPGRKRRSIAASWQVTGQRAVTATPGARPRSLQTADSGWRLPAASVAMFRRFGIAQVGMSSFTSAVNHA
jgi:UDP-N-acetylmuramoyl-L-alanyl-D-glutamate--2,6-diaminopimelate ligase